MDQKNWVSSSSPGYQEDGDEEALSLCDLPTADENQTTHRAEFGSKKVRGEDFNFGSWVGSVSAEPEMCAADDVFFKGQILPFRHSVSSDGGLAMSRPVSRSVSRSESMDHRYSGRLISSRSSSIRSQNSSSSGSSNSTLMNNKQRLGNQFHSHPSPSPQIRSSCRRIPSHRQRNSTIWSLFRVGLVQPPEIELESLKFRSSRNSTCSTSTKSKHKLFDKNIAFLSSCKCSVDTIDTIPLKSVLSNSDNDNVFDENGNEGKGEAAKKRKQALWRYRTLEWLKELSFVGVPDES